jgi:hypothetical protein
MTPEEKERREVLLAFYSHTSRVWNSAITLTLAGAAISIAVIASDLLGKIALFYGTLTAFVLALPLWAVVVYGLVRVVELGKQLQFLESEIGFPPETSSSESSLLEYINREVPRLRFLGFHNRPTTPEAQQLRGRGISIRDFARQHWVALLVWTAVFLVVCFLRLEVANRVYSALVWLRPS